MKITVNVTVEFEAQLEIEAQDADHARDIAESAVARVLDYEGTIIEPMARCGGYKADQGVNKHWQLELTSINGATE